MILLDTNALLILTLEPERLSKAAAGAIKRAQKGSGIAFASITLWEIALLIYQGRINIHSSTEAFLDELTERPGLFILDLDSEIAALAFQFPPSFPGDPADRIIAATARARGLALVTKDQRLQDSPLLQTIW